MWISTASPNVVAIAIALLFLGLGLYRMILPLRLNYLEEKRKKDLKAKYQTNPNAVANAEMWRRRSRVLTEKISVSLPHIPEVSKPGYLEQLLLNSIRWRERYFAISSIPYSTIP